MKFDCDKRKRAKADRKLAEREWHPWFAWRPVRVAPGECRWWEWVYRRAAWRRGRYYTTDTERYWEYREYP